MDFCVACGRDLPTENGKQVCRTCEITADCLFMRLKCPDCGREMKIYHKEINRYTPATSNSFQDLEVDLIYHCECGNDWDSTYTSQWGDLTQSAPTRHYWG